MIIKIYIKTIKIFLKMNLFEEFPIPIKNIKYWRMNFTIFSLI